MAFAWTELVAQKDEIIQEYRAHKYECLLDDTGQMEGVLGQAWLVSHHDVEVQSADGVRHSIGEQILTATGSQLAIPPVPGLSGVRTTTCPSLSQSL
jgi:pyruvate/2-oxoglutarate dehydrogenase complex dihydrolipoamide dehydrogenase (E3) component